MQKHPAGCVCVCARTTKACANIGMKDDTTGERGERRETREQRLRGTCMAALTPWCRASASCVAACKALTRHHHCAKREASHAHTPSNPPNNADAQHRLVPHVASWNENVRRQRIAHSVWVIQHCVLLWNREKPRLILGCRLLYRCKVLVLLHYRGRNPPILWCTDTGLSSCCVSGRKAVYTRSFIISFQCVTHFVCLFVCVCVQREKSRVMLCIEGSWMCPWTLTSHSTRDQNKPPSPPTPPSPHHCSDTDGPMYPHPKLQSAHTRKPTHRMDRGVNRWRRSNKSKCAISWCHKGCWNRLSRYRWNSTG